MIISRYFAKKLIEDGKAEIVGTCSEFEGYCGQKYAIVDRLDCFSVDHFEISEEEAEEIEAES